jgi:hypothetical protein
MNAMLARAVELCEKKRVSFLVYGKTTYDGNENSALTQFKRRNAFEEMKYPRYFLPLTVKGRFAIRLGVHNGMKRLIPQSAVKMLRGLRSEFYQRRYSSGKSLSQTVNSIQ